MKKEKIIKSSVEPVNIKSTEKILNQMKNCICKIKIKNIYSTGFFCKTPNMNFLMTNYHMINEEYINENKKINILLNDDKEVLILDLEIKREKYFNKEYDIALIEIKEKDKIKEYLELDDNLFKNNDKIYYEEKSIYILHYMHGKNVCVSYGILTKISKYDIIHSCSTDNGSSGSPIINLENNKVIGIHKEGSINFDYNKGTLLNYPLIDFIPKFKDNKNINIKSEIEKNNINKDIQVISSYENNNMKKNTNNISKEEYKQEKKIKKNIEIKIKNGLNYLISDSFKRRFRDNLETKKFCHLGILGWMNRGKTFILNLLGNIKLVSGFEHKTEGLCCKYIDLSFEEEEEKIQEKINSTKEKFLVFDSQGISQPLLIDPEEKKMFKDEDIERKIKSNNRDLKVNGKFIKNFLIKNSKMILVVVNQLSLREQDFLSKLKDDENCEELYILHNLFNFRNKRDMLDYINNTIVNSLYFDITKRIFYPIDNEKGNTKEKPFYFIEEEERNGKKRSVITHLILGDIETNDKWIHNLNEKTINFIKTRLRICLVKDFFFIDEKLENELKCECIIDERLKLKKEKNNENFDEDGWEKGKLKLEKNEHKDNYIEDDENKNFEENEEEFDIMGFTPNYLFYKDEQKLEFVIKVECSGIRDDNLKITGKSINEKVYFHILGRKKFPKEINEKDKPFSIYFSVNTEEENFKIDTSEKINKIKPTYENGIYRKVFPIIKDKNPKEDDCNII